MIDNDKVSNSQLWILIMLTVIGVGIFSIPRSVAETAGPDGWMTTILGGLIALLDYYIISRLARKFPGDTLVEIAKKVAGKYLGFLLTLIFWIYMVSIIAMTMRIFGEVVKMSLLTRTPVEVILISFIIVVFFLARGGIEPIVRFDEVAFPIIFFTIIFSFLFILPKSDFTNLLPAFRTPPRKIFLGAYQTTYAYGGFEFILLIIPFIKNPERIFRSGLPAFILTILIYLLVVILSIAKFGVESVKKLIWPTLIAIRSINIPASFIERLEGVIMTQWILFAFTTIAPFIYGAALIPSRLLGHKEFRHFCAMVLPVVYFVAMMPDNVVESYKYLDIITTYLGLPAVFIIPLLLLIVSAMRKIGVKKGA